MIVFLIFSLLWAQEIPLGLSAGSKQRIETSLSEDFVGLISVVQGENNLFRFTKGKTQSGSLLGMDSWTPVSSLTNHIVSVVSSVA